MSTLCSAQSEKILWHNVLLCSIDYVYVENIIGSDIVLSKTGPFNIRETLFFLIGLLMEHFGIHVFVQYKFTFDRPI